VFKITVNVRTSISSWIKDESSITSELEADRFKLSTDQNNSKRTCTREELKKGMSTGQKKFINTRRNELEHEIRAIKDVRRKSE
jgi:hypothetical protein